jgi:hypothetical protein
MGSKKIIMKSNEFVEVIDLVIVKATIKAVKQNITTPAGRSPQQKYLTMSAFYNNLSEDQKVSVDLIIKESVESAVFQFLCVLDGVIAIEDADKGELKLYYERNSKSNLINDPSIDLHDLMNRD